MAYIRVMLSKTIVLLLKIVTFRSWNITKVRHLEKVGVPEVVQEPLDLVPALLKCL